MAYLVVAVLAIIIVSMCCLASRMYRRTKRLEKQLQYEMHDVRNIARTGEAAPVKGETSGSLFIFIILLVSSPHLLRMKLAHLDANKH